jgi:hypothetical protein
MLQTDATQGLHAEESVSPSLQGSWLQFVGLVETAETCCGVLADQSSLGPHVPWVESVKNRQTLGRLLVAGIFRCKRRFLLPSSCGAARQPARAEECLFAKLRSRVFGATYGADINAVISAALSAPR